MNLMEVLNTLFYFIITIGILVFIHELGHFLAAKIFRMRVDRFSIGFPPRAFGRKIGDTDYCVSWIPIGGYVKIAGMIDESFDTEYLKQEPQPWEFRSKPVWQRTIVISAGVIMNLLLAIAILWGILLVEGKAARPITEVGFVMPESAAEQAGLQPGDRMLAINGRSLAYWDDIENIIYAETIGEDLTFTIERSGTTMEFSLPRAALPSLSEQRFGVLPSGVFPVVGRVEGGKPAESIGLRPGDMILTVNGSPISYYTLAATIKRFAGQEIVLQWKREGAELSARVKPTEEGRIGISLEPFYTGPVEQRRFSVAGAFVEGVHDLVGMTGLFLKNIYAILTGSASFAESVGGPVRIAQIATRSAEIGLTAYLMVMAMLSLSLAILNLLPVPALDGGHLVFLAYEGIFRREIPTKIKIAMQQAGFVLLLVFMAFVLYNDIVRF
jgi:regulator of sigma E protease